MTLLATNWSEVTALGTIAAAIATFAAVLVALYQNQYREWRRRPRLTLERRLGPPFDEITREGADPPERAWYRLRVVAAPGKKIANAAEVMVVHAVADGKRIGIEDRSLAWSNIGQAARSIQSGTTRYVDVASIAKADPGAITIEVVGVPTDGRHQVRAGEIGLGLLVAALDTEPRQYSLTIKSQGIWNPDDEFPIVTITLNS